MTTKEPPQDLNDQRRLIAPLLSPSDPADALASYYALWHDPRRTGLSVQLGAHGEAIGFVSVSQTGADLFRPLVTLRAKELGALSSLLSHALDSRRTYRLVVPPALLSGVAGYMEVGEVALSRIYELAPQRFEPIVNVLVQQADGPDGSVRYQIESRGQMVAVSGTNWRSPVFAELFVYVHPAARGRGWGQSVVSACTAHLLAEGVRVLYTAQEQDLASTQIAEALGYVDSGSREIAACCRLKD